jgi:acetyl esterase/lipase
MSRRLVGVLTMCAVLVVAAACGGETTPTATTGAPPVATAAPVSMAAATQRRLAAAGWSPTAPPANAGSRAASWYRSAPPDGTSQLVAVDIPPGPGPFPVVVYFHGSSGLFPNSIDWTAALVDAGYAVVIGCWAPGEDDSVQCPEVPDPGTAASNLAAVGDLVVGSSGSGVAFFGLSSGVTPTVLGHSTNLRALVADSGCPQQVMDLTAPVLVLSSRKDPIFSCIEGWADGLQRAGLTVETKYYDDGGHVVHLNPDTTAASTAAIVDYLDRRLR